MVVCLSVVVRTSQLITTVRGSEESHKHVTISLDYGTLMDILHFCHYTFGFAVLIVCIPRKINSLLLSS